jgi:hypothetical protein
VIGVLVLLLVSVIPAVFVAEAMAKRRRRARWMQARTAIPDDQFYASLGPVPISHDAAIKVRSGVGYAIEMSADLLAASDSIRQLEEVGDGSHPTVIDYFTDLLFVEQPSKESILVTVRDLVIEFEPQLENSVEGQNPNRLKRGT